MKRKIGYYWVKLSDQRGWEVMLYNEHGEFLRCGIPTPWFEDEVVNVGVRVTHPTTEPVKAQAGEPVGYHFSYTTPFGHVVWDIDYTPRPDAIEVYPVVRAHPTTERPYNPLNDYAVISMNPTEPVKAQAGEPVAWMKTNGGNGNEKVFISAHMKQRGYDDFDVPLFTHPTTERRVPDGWKLVPIEPTHLMERAGHEAEADSLGIAAQIYRAMINAAPAKEME